MIRYRAHIALFLCTVISLHVLAVPLSYLNYKLHQDYYATVLCENPEKPITVCGGICYVKKQLPQSTEATPTTFSSKIDISVYFQACLEWTYSIDAMGSLAYAPHPILPPVAYSSSLFHPPQG